MPLTPELLKAIAETESGENPKAVSPSGAQGLMQLMPGTSRRFGVNNPFNPTENLDGSVKYLRFLEKKYNGSVPHIVAAYHAGEGNLDNYIAGKPNGVGPKTLAYVEKVMKKAGESLTRQIGELQATKSAKSLGSEIAKEYQEGKQTFERGIEHPIPFKSIPPTPQQLITGEKSEDSGLGALNVPLGIMQGMMSPATALIRKGLAEPIQELSKGYIPSKDAELVGGLALGFGGIPPGLKNSKFIKPIYEAVTGAVEPVVENLAMNFVPMAAKSATPRARAVAKEFANNTRAIDYKAEKLLTEHEDAKLWTPTENKRMWQSLNERSENIQQGISQNPLWDSLTPKEAGRAEELTNNSEKLWDEGRRIGLIKGEGLPSYTPRMFVDMTTGMAERPAVKNAASGGGSALHRTGTNIRTTSKNLIHRKHLLAKDSEAALQAKAGPGIEMVDDIRTHIISNRDLARAIEGRKMINEIKKAGRKSGKLTVVEGSMPKGFHGFTIPENPSFYSWGPRFKDGKALLDREGKIVMDRKPIYIADEFKGPLTAVMQQPMGAAMKAGMAVKGASMSAIMFSPEIHNLVEWGRALPLIGTKAIPFTPGNAYKIGREMKGNAPLMDEAIKHGLVPIHGMGMTSDVTDMVNRTIQQTRSTANNPVYEGAKKAWKFWHETLLWENIANLQNGIYQIAKEKAVKAGLTEEEAMIHAGHVANRYAGALPKESMSRMAHNIANLSLFSKSYTFGNLGVMKDALTGYPLDVQAQMMKLGKDSLKRTKSYARRQSQEAIMVDIGLSLAINAAGQAGANALRGKPNTEWLPQLHNEPGKHDRMLGWRDDTGRAHYLRLAPGKMGEEFEGWYANFGDKLMSKVSPMSRGLYEWVSGNRGFGEQLYPPDSGPGQRFVIGAMNFMEDLLPRDELEAVNKWMHGTATSQDKLKATLPLMGVTTSKGHPGGPEFGLGEKYDRDEKFYYQEAKQEIRKAVEEGNIQGAIDAGVKYNLTRNQLKNLIQMYQSGGISPNREKMLMKKIFKKGPGEDDAKQQEKIDEFHRLQR